MWHLSQQAKDQFERSHSLPIRESDEEWEIALLEAKEENRNLYVELAQELELEKTRLCKVLPERFRPYVEDGTLNSPALPKKVRQDYLTWMQQQQEQFETLLTAAYENKEKTIPYLEKGAQEVFQQSLHDGRIIRTERDGRNLKLTLDTTGGFTTKAIVELIFTDIVSEHGELCNGLFYIYDELQKTNSGVALRVLWDLTEWTIEAKSIDAQFYYKPAAFYDLMNDSFTDYPTLPSATYTFITPAITTNITHFSSDAPFLNLESGDISLHNGVVFLDDQEIAPVDQLYKFVYTDQYEDPYAHFSEEVPTDELETAAFSEDVEYRIRAWNTLYAQPHVHAALINRILLQADITEEHELMLSIYVNHFFKEGILTSDTISKYASVLVD